MTGKLIDFIIKLFRLIVILTGFSLAAGSGWAVLSIVICTGILLLSLSLWSERNDTFPSNWQIYDSDGVWGSRGGSEGGGEGGRKVPPPTTSFLETYHHQNKQTYFSQAVQICFSQHLSNFYLTSYLHGCHWLTVAGVGFLVSLSYCPCPHRVFQSAHAFYFRQG